MNLDFQILVPGLDYDLAAAGKGPSNDWIFFTTYNTEKANTLKEVGASQNAGDANGVADRDGSEVGGGEVGSADAVANL